MRQTILRQRVAKSILILDTDGIALSPVILCAEADEEGRRRDLPLLEDILAGVSDGKELRANGEGRFELFRDGRRISILEIFGIPP